MELSEVESSVTHFEVPGLGLEAYKSSKMTCPRLEDSIIFKKENHQTKNNITDSLSIRCFLSLFEN